MGSGGFDIVGIARQGDRVGGKRGPNGGFELAPLAVGQDLGVALRYYSILTKCFIDYSLMKIDNQVKFASGLNTMLSHD
jgi:hypothetical protein